MWYPIFELTKPDQLTWQTSIGKYMPDPPENGDLLNPEFILATINGHDQTLKKHITETLVKNKSTDKEKIIKVEFKPINIDDPTHKMRKEFRIISRYKENEKWKTVEPLPDPARSSKDLIEEEMKEHGDKWENIVSKRHIMERDVDWRYEDKYWYDYRFTSGSYPYFVVMTKNWIYFPVEYDGDVWVESIPRNLNNPRYTPTQIGN